jgi:hypothetical protein
MMSLVPRPVLRPSSIAIAAMLVGLAPGPVRADARSDARAKLVQGGEALKSGQFEEALARFQEAYRIVPSPKIHYNFGLAYRGLGRKADALEAFERFLAEATDATRETRQNAERGRAQLVSQVIVLEVKTDLPGAEVFVDGRSYGTNRATPIYLDPGPHQLSVEKAGEVPPFTERINGIAGQRITIMARLARSPGAAEPPPLRVTTPPPPETRMPAPEAPRGPAADVPPAREELRWHRPAAWAAAGGAVLGLGFGTYQLIAANDTFTTFNNTWGCGEEKPNRGGPQCAKLYNDGSSQRTLQYVGFAVGGTLAVASALLFFLAPSDAPATETARVACLPSLSTPGLTCAARF